LHSKDWNVNICEHQMGTPLVVLAQCHRFIVDLWTWYRLKTGHLWAARKTESEHLWAARKTKDWIFVSSQKYWRLDICKQSGCQRDWRLNICERPERLKTEYLWATRKTVDWIFVSIRIDWMLNICEQSDSQRDWGLDICERTERLKTDYLWAARWGRPVWCWLSATASPPGMDSSPADKSSGELGDSLFRITRLW
jgi:hypothetical protein